MLGEPLKSKRDAAVGAGRFPSLPPIIPGEGAEGQNPSQSQPGPQNA